MENKDVLQARKQIRDNEQKFDDLQIKQKKILNFYEESYLNRKQREQILDLLDENWKGEQAIRYQIEARDRLIVEAKKIEQQVKEAQDELSHQRTKLINENNELDAKLRLTMREGY